MNKIYCEKCNNWWYSASFKENKKCQKCGNDLSNNKIYSSEEEIDENKLKKGND